MKKIMIILLSFAVIAAMMSIFSCGNNNPEQPAPTNTPTKTPTTVPSVGPTPVPSIANYNFTDDQTTDWYLGVDSAFSNLTYNTTEGHNAAGCMQVTGDFSSSGAKGEVQRNLGTATDFTGRKITAWINIPADLVDATHPYGVQFFVQDSTWGWDAQWINIASSGWQKYEWVLPGSLNQNITQIVKVGIQISAGTGSPTVANPVTILFDDITW